MKLYYAPGACSLSPHIVARELGLPIQLQKVNTKDKTMEGGGDFWKVNARGYVAQPVDFSAPGPDVRVTLSQGGRVLLVSSKPTRVRLTSSAAAATQSGGRVGRVYTANSMGMPVENLAPGSYVLDVLGGDGKSVLRSMPVMVTAGQTTTVNVD